MAMSASDMADEVIAELEADGKFDRPAGEDPLTPTQLQDVKNEIKAGLLPVYEAQIQHLIDNAVVETTLESSLNTIFTAGTPVPNDGGAALKTAWSAATAAGAKDDAAGGITA